MSASETSTLARHLQAHSMERLIQTEMGVVLRVKLGGTIERVMAFGCDAMLILLAMAGLMLAKWIGLVLLEESTELAITPWADAVMMVLFFVIRFAYFVWFETKKQGQTPGKKWMKLQVIDAHGGTLSGSAILMRNFAREFELVTPLILAVITKTFWDSTHWSLILISCIWVLLIMTLPLWNTRRARLGDLLAGTQVVEVPRAELLEDIDFMLPDHIHYTFTPQQLDMYGNYELGVLEEILRTTAHPGTLSGVCTRITAKIAWVPKGLRPWEEQPRKFLQDFYVALRMRREQQQLYGKRQESKKEGVLSHAPPAQSE